jgi:hypothetical protein
MKPLVPSCIVLAAFILAHPYLGAAPSLSTPGAKPAETPAPSPIPTKSVPTPVRAPGESGRSILIHKPMPPAHWGKVVQYRKEQSFSFSNKDRETLHEFVFQDDSGVIRTATFRESENGNGFWEVLVWDQ